MRLIERPIKGSQRCAITGRTEDPRGFIHTNQILNGWDQEVLLSAAAAEECGRMIGMVSQDEIARHISAMKVMADDIQDLRKQLAALQTVESALNELSEVAA